MTLFHSTLQRWLAIILALAVLSAISTGTFVSLTIVKANTTNGDLSCLDQNNNNVVDIAELFDVIDAYFDGTVSNNLSCVDSNDNDIVDIAELFDVIDAYFEGTPLNTTPTAGDTGNWVTWEEILSYGFEEDQDGLPRIVLQGDAHYSASTNIYLQVDCQLIDDEHELVVYVKELILYSRPDISFTGDHAVVYVIDGERSPSREWAWQLDGDLEFWFAPPLIASNIIEGLSNDPSELLVIIKPGEEYEQTHTFDPRGFSEASKPVLQACQ